MRNEDNKRGKKIFVTLKMKTKTELIAIMKQALKNASFQWTQGRRNVALDILLKNSRLILEYLEGVEVDPPSRSKASDNDLEVVSDNGEQYEK